MSDAANYWSGFYSSRRGTTEPSDFARFVSERYPDHRTVVEFGCGNGRDSIYFGQSGRRVYGLDLCQEAIQQCNELSRENGVAARCEFRAADIMETNEVLSCLQGYKRSDEPAIFYARFFLHSIDESSESSLFNIVGASLRAKDVFCLEFRTTQDCKTPKLFGEHYRRFLRVGDVLAQCKTHQLEIEYSVDGHGFAVFGNEDPHVARVLARRERNA